MNEPKMTTPELMDENLPKIEMPKLKRGYPAYILQEDGTYKIGFKQSPEQSIFQKKIILLKWEIYKFLEWFLEFGKKPEYYTPYGALGQRRRPTRLDRLCSWYRCQYYTIRGRLHTITYPKSKDISDKMVITTPVVPMSGPVEFAFAFRAKVNNPSGEIIEFNNADDSPEKEYHMPRAILQRPMVKGPYPRGSGTYNTRGPDVFPCETPEENNTHEN